MKIIEVKSLEFPEVKVIRFAQFLDKRGYFTEPFRKSDFSTHAEMKFMKRVKFVETMESLSKPGTIRGMHFQWDLPMGKLVRTIRGRMIDLVLDIRKGSPTFGKIIAYDMPDNQSKEYSEWIWVPPGFAHGNVFPEETTIEYFCSAEYNPDGESGISPLSKDLDWSICNPQLKKIFDDIVTHKPIMSDKDSNAKSLKDWMANPKSENFIYKK